ncbi:MAG: hypothetical protein WC459_00840 [Patescibacteria group bacterium]
MIRNLGFTRCAEVDEFVEGHDGLYDNFGGDSYCVSRNKLYLGFAYGDDGCEPLVQETEDEAMERYLTDYEELDDYLGGYDDEDNNKDDGHSLERAIEEAANEALKLQEFFHKQKESCPQEKESCPQEAEEVLDIRQKHFSFGGGYGSTVRPGKNSRRPLIGDRGGKSMTTSYLVQLPVAVLLPDGRKFHVA